MSAILRGIIMGKFNLRYILMLNGNKVRSCEDRRDVPTLFGMVKDFAERSGLFFYRITVIDTEEGRIIESYSRGNSTSIHMIDLEGRGLEVVKDE